MPVGTRSYSYNVLRAKRHQVVMNPDAVTIARELAGQAPSEWYSYFERHQVADPIRAEVESILRAGGTVAEDEPTTGYVVRGSS